MDKLLISGSGKGNSAIYFWCFIYLLVAIAGGVLIYYAPALIYTTNHDWFYTGLVLIILAFIGATAISYCISKTKIDVYESYIEGISVGKYFLWGDYTTKHFRLAYDQITSFDTTSSSITIGATNAAYSCYASNANEIQSVIFNQKQLNEKAKQ